MPVLIDGHNLIGRLSTPSLDEPDDELKLISLLVSYQARTGRAITVVFDPGAASAVHQRRRYGAIEAVFAAQGSSADAVIIGRVQRDREPGRWLVVTSDQKLARAVRQWGARVSTAEAFAADLVPPSQPPSSWKDGTLSPEEVEWWLAEFKGRS